MYLIDFLRTGIYFIFAPYHLLLVLFGVFVRAQLKTPLLRRLWLGAEILTLILCWFGSFSPDGMTVLAAIALFMLAFDLLIGHGIVGAIRSFRWLADWINKENETPEIDLHGGSL